MAVEKRKFSKIPNWRHYLPKNRAKHTKNWQNHWHWINKPFRNTSKPWKWFRSKEIRFRTSWSREMLNGVSLLVNSCFKDRIGRGLYIALWPATKNGFTTIILSAENSRVLWTVKTEWNYHRGSVPNAIDAFESSIEDETATVPRETWQSYSPAWQCSATCRKTGQDILGNAELWGLTPSALLSRRCSFWLPFVSIDGTRRGSSAFSLWWRSRKMDRLKRPIVFSR